MNAQKKAETRATSWKRHEVKQADIRDSRRFVRRAKMKVRYFVARFSKPTEVDDLDFGDSLM